MAQFLRPSSDIVAGGWTGSYVDIDEETPNDGDYLESTNNPTSDVFECGLSAGEDPGVVTGHIVRYRARTTKQDGLVVRLVQGGTTIASQTPSLTSSFAEYSFTLEEAEAGNIADYAALSLQFEGNGAGNTNQYVSWAEFEIPEAADSDDLTADALDGASPAVDQPTFGQVHELTAESLGSGIPAPSEPTVGQGHALSVGALVSSGGVLTDPDLESSSEDALTADSLDASAPAVDLPDVGQAHVLTADALESGTPGVANVDIGQEHGLGADDVMSATPMLTSADVGQGHALEAEIAEATGPSLAQPNVGQGHAIGVDGLEAGAPQADAPMLGTEGSDALATAGFAAAAPDVGEATIAQVHALLGAALAAGAPLVDGPSPGQDHTLSAEGLTTEEPQCGEPALAEGTHALQAGDVDAGAPQLGSVHLAQIQALVAEHLLGAAPMADGTTAGQEHALGADGLVGATAEMETPSIEGAAGLNAEPLTSGPPSPDEPALGLVGLALLEAAGVEGAGPALGGSALWSGFRVGRIWTSVTRRSGERRGAERSLGRASGAMETT